MSSETAAGASGCSLLAALEWRKVCQASDPTPMTCAYTGKKAAKEVLIYKPDESDLDCRGWMKTAFSLRGRPLLHILPPLALVMALAVLRAIGVVTELETELFGSRWQEELGVEKFYSLLGVPLAFLLVYRINRSAVRYYEARAAAGMMIGRCRILAGEAVAFCAHDAEARDEVCRWVVAIPLATRNFLRAEDPDPLREIDGVLSRAEARRLQLAPNQWLFCCDRMRSAIMRATRSNTVDHPAVVAIQLQKMEESIADLTVQSGAMERINNTPLPFAYVSHIRTCLVFYLLFLPFALPFYNPWLSVLMVLIVAFALLGTEAAAVACERPFGPQRSHLPMDAFINVVSENVRQILKQALADPLDDCDNTGSEAPAASPAARLAPEEVV